jgi:hypothetical protein
LRHCPVCGLLFLTGGVANPFVILFLAAFPSLGLALVCAMVLARWSLPLPWFAGESLPPI